MAGGEDQPQQIVVDILVERRLEGGPLALQLCEVDGELAMLRCCPSEALCASSGVMAKRRQSHGVGEALLPTAQGPHSIASLNDMIGSFVDLDLNGLRLQWRNHLGETPPAHLPRWLLLRILAYRILASGEILERRKAM